MEQKNEDRAFSKGLSYLPQDFEISWLEYLFTIKTFHMWSLVENFLPFWAIQAQILSSWCLVTMATQNLKSFFFEVLWPRVLIYAWREKSEKSWKWPWYILVRSLKKLVLRWRSRFDTVSCEVNAVHGVVVPYSHGRYQVCRMSSDTIRTNTVHLLSSKTCSTHLLFIDMQHIVRWKHGRRDRFCNSFRRYITGRRKFGIAEAF